MSKESTESLPRGGAKGTPWPGPTGSGPSEHPKAALLASGSPPGQEVLPSGFPDIRGAPSPCLCLGKPGDVENSYSSLKTQLKTHRWSLGSLDFTTHGQLTILSLLSGPHLPSDCAAGPGEGEKVWMGGRGRLSTRLPGGCISLLSLLQQPTTNWVA